MLTTDAGAPSFAQLRPMPPATATGFPVYDDLVERVLRVREHPDDTLAHLLAVCAGYAYSSADTVAAMAARMGLAGNRCRMVAQYVDAMFIWSTAYLVQSADGRLVVLAYRGTEPARVVNWLTDADVSPERIALAFPGTQAATYAVHAGFYRNVRATRYEVVAALERALDGRSVLADGEPVAHPMEALLVTGHSLGGAMAALFGTMLVRDPRFARLAATLRGVYTFGQPMVGEPAFARACAADPALAGRVARYVFRHDVVPHLPPRESGPFEHFGTELRSSGEWPWAPAEQASQQSGLLAGIVETPLAFVARRLPALRGVPFHYSIDDHGPQHYVAALTPPGVPNEFGDDFVAGRARPVARAAP